MSKTADRIDRIEAKLDELVALMRILVLRGGGNLPSDDDIPDVPIPSLPPQFPPSLPPVEPTVPPVFPQPWQPPQFPSVPDTQTTCSKCGMKFEGVMGYVCQDPQCPMGLGPVTC